RGKACCSPRVLLGPVILDRGHEPAETITAGRSVGERYVGPHLGIALLAEERWVSELPIPLRQVAESRDECARAAGRRRLHRIAVLQAFLFVGVPGRTTRDDVERLAGAGLEHTQRLQDVLLEELSIGFAADFFQDQRQEILTS